MEKSVETGKIVIVHDSASSLPDNLRTKEFGDLIEVPLTIAVESGDDDKEWIDHPFESSSERAEFVNDLRTGKISTSQPNPEAYKRVFRDIISNGVTEIAVVPMSGQLGGSMRSALSAAEDLKEKANIFVADCKTVSIGQGLLITQADMENKRGEFNNAKDLVNRVEGLSKELYVAQAFPNLEFLRKGGRIGLVASMLANAFGIIPIIGANAEGKLVPIDKQRGWPRTRESIINYVSKGAGQRAVRLALVYFESNQLDNLRNQIKDIFTIATDENGEKFDILECEQSMVLGAHSGPEVIGLGALVIDKKK